MPVLAVTLIAGFLLGLGVLFAWRHSLESGGAAPGGASRVLAVLPFENLGDSTTDYFADGITDAVRGKLSSLPGLQVIASTSSNEYKDSGKPLPVIARELEADYLLIARIRWAKAGDGSSRVKVSPELVDVGRGGAPKVKWQQPFDAEITDVFTVQADIADQVADALDLALGTGQKQTLTERPTANLAAYDAFLKGEASGGLTVADAPSLRAAINYYEQAVALDSSFAAAWARLGRAHGAFYYNVTPTPAAAEAAKRATDRSIALAPSRPDGWLAQCEYYQTVITEYERALEACRKGLALTPENAELLTAAALSEQGLGRWDAALASLEKARMLDPRSALTARRLAHTLLRLRPLPRGARGGRSGPRRVSGKPRSDREQGDGAPGPRGPPGRAPGDRRGSARRGADGAGDVLGKLLGPVLGPRRRPAAPAAAPAAERLRRRSGGLGTGPGPDAFRPR